MFSLCTVPISNGKDNEIIIHSSTRAGATFARFVLTLGHTSNLMAVHQQNAVLLTGAGGVDENLVLGHIDKPTPAAGQVLVKIKATALNPVDWKMAKFGFLVKKFPHVLGCDMAGIVEAVGPEVTTLHVGDHVWGYTKLGTPGTGTFAEYCVAPAKQLGKKPPHLSFEQASTLGVGTLTAYQGLYHPSRFHLPPPSKKAFDHPEFLLVWGGSGSVGSLVVQLASISGFTVIATCSERNFDYVRSLGAAHVLDYGKADVVEEIKKLTHGKLRYAYDAISSASADKCIESLTESGEVFLAHCADAPKLKRANVKVCHVVIGGEVFDTDAAFFQSAYHEIQALIDSKRLQPNLIEHIPNGLKGIPDALRQLAAGKVSGKKLVATVVA